jgi:type I restriction enzyme, S subunit
MAKLSDVAELIMGQSPPSKTYNESSDGLPFFQGKTDFGFRHPSPTSFCTAPLKIAKPHDILISVRAPVGPTNIADQECCIGRGLAAIRPRTVDGNFLFFNLRYLEKYIASLGTGSTFHAINKAQLASVDVNEHELSIEEQRKIAVVLGTVQRAIEEQERMLQLTTKLKKSLLHKLFTEGLRGESQKMTEIGPVPESWDITELGRVVVLFGGYAFKSDESIPSSNTQLVRMGNLYQNKLDLTRSPIFYPEDFAQKYPRFVLKPGDLIMSLTGTSGKEDYGFTVEIESVSKTLLLNQRIVRIDPISEQLSKDFLLYFLLSRQFLDHLYPTAKGMKQANLSTHAMKVLKIPMPNIDEQKEISNILRILDRRIDFHQKQSTIYTSLFGALLHQLMTAQIRVNDFDLKSLVESSDQNGYNSNMEI